MNHHIPQKAEILVYCHKNNIKVTRWRNLVLDIILKQTGVIKAYQVLAELQKNSTSRLGAPTAYRSLDFWAEHGVLHKIPEVNGYILCRHRHTSHDGSHPPFMLVCRICGMVYEHDFDTVWQQLLQAVDMNRFSPDVNGIVLTGICAKCQ